MAEVIEFPLTSDQSLAKEWLREAIHLASVINDLVDERLCSHLAILRKAAAHCPATSPLGSFGSSSRRWPSLFGASVGGREKLRGRGKIRNNRHSSQKALPFRPLPGWFAI